MNKDSLIKELSHLKKKYVNLRVQYTRATDEMTRELMRKEINAIVKRAKEIRATLEQEVGNGF